MAKLLRKEQDDMFIVHTDFRFVNRPFVDDKLIAKFCSSSAKLLTLSDVVCGTLPDEN